MSGAAAELEHDDDGGASISRNLVETRSRVECVFIAVGGTLILGDPAKNPKV